MANGNQNRQNQRIIFLPDSDPVDIILNILKNNGINETLEDVYKKSKEGKISQFETVSNLTKNLFSEKVLEKDLISCIQQQMEVSENTAKKIANDIKTKLVPILIKITIKEGEKKEEPNILQKMKPPLGVEQVLSQQQKKPPNEVITKPSKIEKIINPAPKKKSRFPQKPISEKLTSKQPQKQDSYREPID